MKTITINNKQYEVIKNYKDAIDIADLETRITEYYNNFDYILGDYAYGKVRLKGFNEKGNKQFKPMNDYSKIEEYIEKYCAYECKHFIIRQIKKEIEK
ncbi:MAG: YutD family protein [Bacilli bacterium]|nr:YutD family protein [Bacilli bacterium]